MVLRIRPAIFLLFLLCAALVPLFALAEHVPSLPGVRTSEELAAICQKAKNQAASRGHSDVENTVKDNTGAVLTDTCVAAVLNPALSHLGPTNPQSYMCVGKRARIGVNSLGLITNLNVPDPTVPSGTCATMACTDYANLSPTCIAANRQTSLVSEAVKFLDSFRSFFGFPADGGSATPFSIGIRG